MQQKILIKWIQYNSTSKKQHCYQCLQQPLRALPFDKEQSQAKEELMARWSACEPSSPTTSRLRIKLVAISTIQNF
jgi:hypothetical protein